MKKLILSILFISVAGLMFSACEDDKTTAEEPAAAEGAAK